MTTHPTDYEVPTYIRAYAAESFTVSEHLLDHQAWLNARMLDLRIVTTHPESEPYVSSEVNALGTHGGLLVRVSGCCSAYLLTTQSRRTSLRTDLGNTDAGSDELYGMPSTTLNIGNPLECETVNARGLQTCDADLRGRPCSMTCSVFEQNAPRRS